MITVTAAGTVVTASHVKWRRIAVVLGGIILLWFTLTALAVIFVAVDIRSTPESPVLKWAFVLISAYTGPFGAFLYVLGCREPLPGLHARYVAVRWRQVLGSTMHCVAGDGLGILAGAAIGSALRLPAPAHIALEYFLGFGFGWTIFQALFMREMAGGSFARSLRLTFIPEFLSMNALMAGMVPVMMILMAAIPGSESALGASFWFIMSIALLTGACVAYPINWWLVARHLKHGMMTVRSSHTDAYEHADEMAANHRSAQVSKMEHDKMAPTPSPRPSLSATAGMALLSIALFAAGIAIAVAFGSTP